MNFPRNTLYHKEVAAVVWTGAFQLIPIHLCIYIFTRHYGPGTVLAAPICLASKTSKVDSYSHGIPVQRDKYLKYVK